MDFASGSLKLLALLCALLGAQLGSGLAGSAYAAQPESLQRVAQAATAMNVGSLEQVAGHRSILPGDAPAQPAGAPAHRGIPAEVDPSENAPLEAPDSEDGDGEGSEVDESAFAYARIVPRAALPLERTLLNTDVELRAPQNQPDSVERPPRRG